MAARRILAAVLVLVMIISCSRGGFRRLLKTRKNKQRANIIFILTDDLDSELGSMSVMNKTRNLLQREGAEFVNAYVTTPMCCPSRSSILTGMYVHNHNVLTNNINCSSPSWRKGPERRNFGRFISDAGYNTGYFGKYLNEYDGTWIPAGWREWVGLIRNSKFYNYTLRRNRAFERHGANYHRDYLTDLITNNSITFFKRSKKRRPNQPVLMVLSMPAPHGPEDSAPQHKHMYANITSPRTPHWNVHSSDKHWILRQNAPLTSQKIAYTDFLYRKRLLTLLSVDKAVERVVHMLQNMKLENETYVIFTSDHGYHLGQFRLIKGKSMPYEMDIKVPFYIRGPGIPKNIRMNEIVLNIDLAPTMLDMAGVRPPRTMDGQSIMKLFRRMTRKRPQSKKRFPAMWRDTFLVQRGKMTKATWKSLSSKKKIPAAKKTLKKGSRRRVNLCLKSKYKSPCQPGQSWECVYVAGRNRLRKCKNRVSPSVVSVAKKCTCYRPKTPVIRLEQRTSKPKRLGDSTGWQQDNQSEPSIRRKRGGLRVRTKGRRKSLSTDFHRRFNKELRRAALRYKHSKLHALKTSEREAFTNNLEHRLVKLSGKIAGMKLKLQQMRDRKKRLMRIRIQTSFQDNFEPFPCECVPAKGKENKAGKTRRRRQQESEARSRVFRKRNVMKRKKKKRGDGFKAQLEKRIKSRNAKKSGKKKRGKKCAKMGMTCYHHTKNHWKTEPRWTKGEFCTCTNAANNTYHCLRTINATHNFLYCEFVTDFLEYFDLNSDPYQLRNIVNTISRDVLKELHTLLEKMKGCKGSRECSHYYGQTDYSSSRESIDRIQIPAIFTSPTPPNATNGSSLKTPVLNNITTAQLAVGSQSPKRRKNGRKRLQNPSETSARNSSKEEMDRRLQNEFTTSPPSFEKRPSYKVVTRPVKFRKRKKTRLNKKRKSRLRKKKPGNKGSQKSKRKQLFTRPTTREMQTVKPTENPTTSEKRLEDR